MKIVVCGPPHSGKSVFLGGLCENLPRAQRYLFRACPDGEGTWTYKGNGSESYRRKGKFSQEIVDWYCQSLKNCEMAPIILVDIGGIPSQENCRILIEGGVTHAVILAGNLEKVPEWESFLKNCGIEVVATIHSDYNGMEDNASSNPMVVHHLERGDQTIKDRPAIQVVAEKILKLTEKEEGTMDFLKEDVLSIAGLAEALGKTQEERVLPNGKKVSQIVWAGEDLTKIAELIHNNVEKFPTHVKIDGFCPNFLAVALVHELHPLGVSINSPDGYVAVGCQLPDGNGRGISFEVKEKGSGWKEVIFILDPSKPLKPSQLEEIAPPVMPMGSKIVVNGRGPNWLTASIAMAYHGVQKAVATFQPGTGYTVAMTHSAEVELGSTIA